MTLTFIFGQVERPCDEYAVVLPLRVRSRNEPRLVQDQRRLSLVPNVPRAARIIDVDLEDGVVRRERVLHEVGPLVGAAVEGMIDLREVGRDGLLKH